MPTAIQDTSTESLTGILTNVASHPNQITGLFAQASKDPEATSSSRPTPKDCPPYITTAATTSPSPRPSAPKTYSPSAASPSAPPATAPSPSTSTPPCQCWAGDEPFSLGWN